MAAPDPSAMFEPEVVAELRTQFDAADKDGNGELDASEACELFARNCDPRANPADVKKLADNLRNQMDGDRSGTISFNEYCFRFGRRYQHELRRRRSSGETSLPAASATSGESESAAQLRREREALEREREALRREREEMERARSSSSTGGPTSQTSSSQAQQAHTSRTLYAGSVVMIQGLAGAVELNGRRATVVRFDEASRRYVVQLDGDGGQKSLRSENLVPSSGGSSGSSNGMFADIRHKAMDCFNRAAANVQVWLAGYETWQILLGVGVVLLFIMAFFQVNGRYTPSGRGRHASGSYRAPTPAPGHRYDDMDSSSYQEAREDHYHRQQRHHDRYDAYDGGYDGGYFGGGGGGGNNNQLYTMIIVGGLGFLCWKGIIPVQNMSWFQLYMLWNMVSPLITGGRGGGYHGGYGRRRRGFW